MTAGKQQAHSLPLILASQSPRRLELLDQLGLSAVVRPVAADESPEPRETPLALAQRLAELKCREALEAAGNTDEVIVAADTVVDRDGEILGKPDDAEDAVLMLLSLAGRSHWVHTGVAVANPARETFESTVASTEVWLSPFDMAQAQRYAASEEPLGKAGAYAIQGKAARFVARIEGSYSNVMGLPLYEIVPLLENAGIVLP